MGDYCTINSLLSNIMKYLTFIAVVLSCLAAALAMPYPYPYAMPHDVAVGRVKIQAYRGPSENKGGYESFAPWGFYLPNLRILSMDTDTIKQNEDTPSF